MQIHLPASSEALEAIHESVVPPVISTIVMLRSFARRQRASMSAYFSNSLTPPSSLGLLGVSPRGGFPSVGQRVARSLPQRWPAVPPRGQTWSYCGSRPSTRAHGRGGLVAAPFQISGEWKRQPLAQNDPNRTDHSASQNSNRNCIRRLLRLVEFRGPRPINP